MWTLYFLCIKFSKITKITNFLTTKIWRYTVIVFLCFVCVSCTSTHVAVSPFSHSHTLFTDDSWNLVFQQITVDQLLWWLCNKSKLVCFCVGIGLSKTLPMVAGNYHSLVDHSSSFLPCAHDTVVMLTLYALWIIFVDQCCIQSHDVHIICVRIMPVTSCMVHICVPYMYPYIYACTRTYMWCMYK